MQELIIKDAGRRYTVQFSEGLEAPAPITEEIAPHLKFIEWWKFQCNERSIAYRHGGSAGIRIIKNLLKQHTYSELQRIGVRFFLDHGHELKDTPNHFILFTQRVPQVVLKLGE